MENGADVEFDSLEISHGSVARFMARNGLGASVPYRVIYEAYINSAQWRARRDAYFSAHPRACAACDGTENVQLHHATYERFTAELDDDLAPLCVTCHAWVHHLHRSSRHGLRAATDAVVSAGRSVAPSVPMQRPPAGRMGTSSDQAFQLLREGQAAASRVKETREQRAARIKRDQERWRGHPLTKTKPGPQKSPRREAKSPRIG